MTNNAGILNEWEKITIWCMNHSTPIQMEVTQYTETHKSPFFACVNRSKIGETHPVCANRLNLDDYQGIVYKLFAMIAEDPFGNFTNRTFTYLGARHKTKVTVLEYNEEHIRLGIRNLTILR